MSVRGVLASEPVTVVSVDWHGPDAVTLVYRDGGGEVGQQLLFRGDEPTLIVGGGARRLSFDGDGELFRLASEARRIARTGCSGTGGALIRSIGD